ncbi:MAG: metallophosphoesterase [Deltaproteobacteria bacterium]|nr:metallophosphoesterase [Deltaproteobacteria bacterium]MDQ3297020.1 metallophosphoesterase [Myxococcota bacterium]
MIATIARIALSSSLSAAIHAYVWWRLVRRVRLPRRWHIVATIAFVLLFLSVPITTASRNHYPGLSSTLGWVAMPWMALVGLLLVVLVAIDVGRLAIWLGRKVAKRRAPDVDPERRLFLARITGGAAVTVASASVARGMIEARGTHEIVDVEIRLAKLPRALDGFTIVQLSDLHVGLTIDRAFVQRVVDQTNRLAPDLVALTGDLVDGKVEDLRDDFAPIGQLRAKHGVFAVTGNHEYYSGADPWIAELRRLGARYLRNELVTIGDGAASFDLAGVDDHGGKGWAGHGEDLASATAARDPSRALVLLAHQPRQVRRASKHGVDLQLSGHTHGGQIWPWHYIVKLQQGGLLAGRYQYGDTQLYVTRGCGYWGPPVRVLAPLEITRVILRSTQV